mmetsp:Transcript_14123/g.55613  ORF Transcript_14123/g.55613 Transcript_14123/m.55613 type:complete len:274 (-) Transcript_14123:923-1744(-)
MAVTEAVGVVDGNLHCVHPRRHVCVRPPPIRHRHGRRLHSLQEGHHKAELVCWARETVAVQRRHLRQLVCLHLLFSVARLCHRHCVHRRLRQLVHGLHHKLRLLALAEFGRLEDEVTEEEDVAALVAAHQLSFLEEAAARLHEVDVQLVVALHCDTLREVHKADQVIALLLCRVDAVRHNADCLQRLLDDHALGRAVVEFAEKLLEQHDVARHSLDGHDQVVREAEELLLLAEGLLCSMVAAGDPLLRSALHQVLAQHLHGDVIVVHVQRIAL